MDIQAYLDRIEYRGPLRADPETLRQLHLSHLLHVPFENLSIQAHERVLLDDAALFKKIVVRRRGGFCYELNGLFGALLRQLGFEVTRLSARVANAEGVFGPDFDHMTLMVRTKGDRWLADVGFGDSFVEPLRLEPGAEQQQRANRYRITQEDGGGLLLERALPAAEWKSQYRFSLKPYQYADYAEMCRFHQTSPESHFTRQRICSRLTPQGRISLSDMRLIVTADDTRSEHLVTSLNEYQELLRNQFGIVM